MATRTVQDQPDLTIPEDKIVRAKLLEIKDEVVKYTDRQTGQPAEFTKCIWWYEVIGGEFQGRKVRGETGATITNHPNNRFRQWAENLLGRELTADMAVDDDDLVGLQCDITVKHEHYEKNGEKRIAEKVDEVMPISGTGAQDVPF